MRVGSILGKPFAAFAAAWFLVLGASAAWAIDPYPLPPSQQDFFSAPVPGYLGVYVRDMPVDASGAPVAGSPKQAQPSQVQVVAVDHDAPAWKAGIRVNDRVLELDGRTVKNCAQLNRLLRQKAPGETVKLLLARKGKPVRIAVRLANRTLLEQRAWAHHYSVPNPASEQPAKVGVAFDGQRAHDPDQFHTLIPNPLYVGADVSPVRAQLADFFGVTSGTGLLVESVSGDSPASRSGLRAGDVILRVNSEQMNTRNDWMNAIRKNRGEMVKVSIMRNKRQRTLMMAVGSSAK